MTPGRRLICSIWEALHLDIPEGRRRHLLQFLVGLEMHPVSYVSLLRAMARAVIEAGLVPVRRDAAHDPVELIAAAVAVAVVQWDRHARAERGVWSDIAVRVAAFRALFRVTVATDDWLPVTRMLRGSMVEASADPMLRAGALGDGDVEGVLAEWIVVGHRSPVEAAEDAATVTALPLAQGLLLVRGERYDDALAVFKGILERVSCHTIALQQAARCCSRLGELTQAAAYARRAAFRVARSRTCAATPYSGPKRPTGFRTIRPGPHCG